MITLKVIINLKRVIINMKRVIINMKRVIINYHISEKVIIDWPASGLAFGPRQLSPNVKRVALKPLRKLKATL